MMNRNLFVEPDDPNIRIWRYMDFAKFVSMLDHGGLYFPTADQLGDPFEGSIPRKVATVQEEVARELGRLAHINHPQSARSDDLAENSAEMSHALYSIQSEPMRKWFGVSCWHINADESSAMWQIYSKSGESIALQSTFSRLRACLDTSIGIGIVNYVDYETAEVADKSSILNMWERLMHKRSYFSFEQELRAIKRFVDYLGASFPTMEDWSKYMQQLLDGLPPELREKQWEGADLNQLIENIYIAPTAPIWFKELIERVIAKYDYTIPVKQSSMTASPIF